jgi:hypothetical protein
MKKSSLDFFKMCVQVEQTQEYYNNLLSKIMETRMGML